MIKVVVAGWRGAQRETHSEAVFAGLEVVQSNLELLYKDEQVLVLSGDNPLGGLDDIVKGWVSSPGQQELGWRWESRRAERSERVPGTGVGNYRMMMRAGDVALLVVFPGPNDTDSREAIMWATRYGVAFMGFPIPASTWGGGRRF